MNVFDRNEEVEDMVRSIVIENEELYFQKLMDYWKDIIEVISYDMTSEVETTYWDITNFLKMMDNISLKMMDNISYKKYHIPELNMMKLLDCVKQYNALCEYDYDDHIEEMNVVIDKFCEIFEEGIKEYFKRINSRYYICEEFMRFIDNPEFIFLEIEYNDEGANDYKALKQDFLELLEEEVDDNFAINNEKKALLKELEQMKAKVQQLEEKIASL